MLLYMPADGEIHTTHYLQWLARVFFEEAFLKHRDLLLQYIYIFQSDLLSLCVKSHFDYLLPCNTSVQLHF